MADNALMTRQNANPGYNLESARFIGSRTKELREAVDRGRDRRPVGTPKFMGQVVSLGSMPTSPDKVFMMNPVECDADDTEGAIPSFTADTSRTIPVIVLGQPPSIGAYMTAYLVGGRWVTEQISNSNNSACYKITCGPCSIPKADLLITFSGTETDACTSATSSFSVSFTMVYNPVAPLGDVWLTACTNDGNVHNPWSRAGQSVSWRFGLRCDGVTNSIVLWKRKYSDTTCTTLAASCSSAPSTPCSALTFHTCSPFSLTFSMTDTAELLLGDCGPPQRNTFSGITAIITGPITSFGTCPVCFHVQGCMGAAVSGATVQVFDSMMTLIVSGTTDASGNVTLDVGSAGPYTVTTTATGFLTLTQTRSLTCGAFTTIQLAQKSKICVTGCNNAPVVGATVAISALGLSDVTDISGCVSFDIPVVGTQTVTVTGVARYASYSSARTVGNCLQVDLILSADTGFFCVGCFNAPIPNTLHVVADGVNANITQVGGAFPTFCMEKVAAFVEFPTDADPFGCTGLAPANNCNTFDSPAAARFTLVMGCAPFGSCTLQEETWGATDCSSTDITCTGLTSDRYLSTCATFSPPSWMLGSICDQVWGGFVDCHVAQLNHITEVQPAAACPNNIPVNITFLFSGNALQGNLFTTVNIIE